MLLKDKVVLITGGASGIGAAVTRRFIQEGAKVSIIGRSLETLEQMKEEFNDNLLIIQGDVSKYEDNERAVKATVEQFGKLDVFIANAGVFDGFAKFADVTPDALSDAYDYLLNINVKGSFFGAKAALEELQKTNGNIIFTVSGASFYPDGGGVWYTASKHAQIGLMRQLAFELAPNIRVNAVAPGGTLTALTVIPPLRTFTKSVDNDTKASNIKRRNLLQLAQMPEDHVAAYVLLASDQSRAITGEVISSDGGLSVRGLG
ncbi:SDR family NAD(P)-dependent oxidoreductase [Gottfriedia acidiceleris]|uniref:SDR family NAD(P)-dependent oxidoreductase n=1 Tax=Gottfriedia acidiceleris TaxID=371036 RepID=UPI00101D2065|nr:SDR family NAD(P)-dependent oxidoreductase [Gottfriedia acidiceleris]